MNLIVFAIVAVIIVVGVEYLTRGVPSPWRWIILALAAVGLLLWLFSILGVVTIPL